MFTLPLARALVACVGACLLVIAAAAQTPGAHPKGGGAGPSTLPIITSIAPAQKGTGAGISPFTVNGSGFVSGAIIYWNGAQNTPTTYKSSRQLTTTIAASKLSKAGYANVTVVNPDGGTSNAVVFTIAAPNIEVSASLYSNDGTTVSLYVNTSNTGTVGATNVQITAATLRDGSGGAAVPTGTALPISMGNIAMQNYSTAQLDFALPNSIGHAGILKLYGTYNGGMFGATVIVNPL